MRFESASFGAIPGVPFSSALERHRIQVVCKATGKHGDYVMFHTIGCKWKLRLQKWIERFLHSFENERSAFAFDLVEEKPEKGIHFRFQTTGVSN